MTTDDMVDHPPHYQGTDRTGRPIEVIDVIQDTIVGKLGIRVIMTSHSPSTIALAPEESLFEIKGRPTAISKVSRDEAIGLLSEGLVVVKPGMRCVLVEGEFDSQVYAETLEELARMGHVPADVSLFFLPAGRKASSDPAGGRSQGEKWVPNLRDAGFKEIVGLVDNDNQPTSAPGVAQLGRHSVENYLVDPLVVYAALVEAGCAPTIEGVEVPFGGERDMCKLPQAALDAIARVMHQSVEPHLPNLQQEEKSEVEVKYANGACCKMPRWLYTRSGKKEVMSAYRAVYDNKAANPSTLRKALLRTLFIPLELRDVFTRLHTM